VRDMIRALGFVKGMRGFDCLWGFAVLILF